MMDLENSGLGNGLTDARVPWTYGIASGHGGLLAG